MALALPVLIAIVLLGVVLVVLSLRAPSTATSIERNAAQHLTRARGVALVLAVIGFVMAVIYGGGLGVGFVIAPGLAGVLALVCLTIAERSLPTEVSPQRTVSLERRRPMSWVRPITWSLGGVSLALTVGALVMGWVTASADDSGRAGRAVKWSITGGEQGHSPWPGSFYGVPTLVALATAALAFAVSLHSVATRAQVNADAHAELSDEQMRRRSAGVVQGVVLVVLGMTQGALCLMLLGATSVIDAGAPAWVSAAHWLGIMGTVAGAVTVVVGTVVGAKR